MNLKKNIWVATTQVHIDVFAFQGNLQDVKHQRTQSIGDIARSMVFLPVSEFSLAPILTQDWMYR